uniref:Uncharacterized protein n=1 Tax=Rhizophora mucronata TaxID=61149 RepID=A0A2P2NP92_RHIMU
MRFVSELVAYQFSGKFTGLTYVGCAFNVGFTYVHVTALSTRELGK